MFGFTCHVDLFAVAGEPASTSPTHALAFRPPSSPHALLPLPETNAWYPARMDVNPSSHVPGDTFQLPRDGLHRSSAHGQDAPRQPYGTVPPPSLSQPQDEQCTMLLAGEAFVQCSLVDKDGRRVAMFVFSVCSSALIS